MSDPLSVLAGAIAIFDETVKLYRFAIDIKNAAKERKEFGVRLDTLKVIEQALKTGLEGHPEWQKELVGSGSPLSRLRDVVSEMRKTLENPEVAEQSTEGTSSIVRFRGAMAKVRRKLGKAGSENHKLGDVTWHSEKKTLGEYFRNIDSYCGQINTILSAAGLHENMQVRIEVVEFRKDIKREKIEAWIPSIDFHARHQQILDEAESSGKEFLNSQVFKTWKRGNLRKLRCFGDKGSGKTVLCSMIVNHMRHLRVRDPLNSTSTLYLYIERTPEVVHDVKRLVGSLLKQLMDLRTTVSPFINDAWTRLQKSSPSEEVIKSLFAEEVKSQGNLVHVVIDAIDLLDSKTRNFIDRTLPNDVCPQSLRLLTTSTRDEEGGKNYKICDNCKNDAELYLQCPDCGFAAPFNLCFDCNQAGQKCLRNRLHKPMEYPPTLDVAIRTSKADLEAFIRSTVTKQMPKRDNTVDPAMNPANSDGTPLGRQCAKHPCLLQKIIDRILENSEGKFLIAKLLVNTLEDMSTESEIEDTLDALGCYRVDLADRINNLYTSDIENRIVSQGPSRAKKAFEILSVIYSAKRKLRFTEFQHALATKPKDTKSFNHKNLMDQNEALKLTNGFITIGRDRDQIVRLTDERPLNDYFDKFNQWFEDCGWGQVDIAQRCVRYLSFETFAKPCTADELQAKEKEHPFLSYAVQHWGTHVLDAANEDEEYVLEFLKSPSRNQAYIQCAWELDTNEGEKWDVRRTIFPLHICAWFNLCNSIAELADNIDYDIQEGTYGQTALMYACRRGHVKMINHLLHQGASLNVTSDRGRTALFEAILRMKNGLVQNNAIVGTLLNHKRYLEIDTNITNHEHFDRTALMVVIDQNTPVSTKIARSILRLPNVNRNIQDSRGNTALSLAASRGNLEVINTLLIFEDLELNLQDTIGRTALMNAVEGGNSNIVDVLLRRGAAPDLRDLSGATAAFIAAEKGQEEVFTCLMGPDGRVDLAIPDNEGRTLMHVASENGNVAIMQLLANSERYTAELSQRDKYGMTALHSACRFSQLDVTKFLLERGVSWKDTDFFNRTPFEIACQYGHEALMELLGKQDTSPGTIQRTKLEDLPLWCLAVQQRFDAISSVIASDNVDFSIREPGTNRTILHCAVRYCKSDVGARILEALPKAENEYLNDPDSFQDTPLHLAVRQQCLACTNALLAHDPNLDELDRFGLTPLDQACRDKDYDIAMALVNAGATIVSSNSGLKWMIFEAAEAGNDEVVKLLLDAGADRMIPDDYGRTIDMLIRRTGNMKLLKIVQSYPSSKYQAPKAKQGEFVTVTEIEPLQASQKGRLRRLIET